MKRMDGVVPLVSFPDLYAGKIVAALDRQHPRDLFDVRDLLANEGVSDELRRAFIVYILSHNRPMGEVLAPTRKDLRQEFEAGFAGMTEEPVTLEALYDAREALIAEVVGKMPAEAFPALLQGRRTRLGVAWCAWGRGAAGGAFGRSTTWLNLLRAGAKSCYQISGGCSRHERSRTRRERRSEWDGTKTTTWRPCSAMIIGSRTAELTMRTARRSALQSTAGPRG
jgi:hypothetical protein